MGNESMNNDPRKRSDFSRFLVHLTRRTKEINAEDNLINILRKMKIEARNFHCLFAPKLKRMELTSFLQNKFKTVCFTETPLDQIHKMTAETYPRKIKLKPYGLVFWRDELLKKGANPAIYINSRGTTLKDYLIDAFDNHFKDVKAYKKLKVKEDYSKEIVHYYSLINVISDKYDFSWEREWRYSGSFEFEYADIVAIVAQDPDAFEKKCKDEMDLNEFKYIKKIPIISPYWGYEEVIETMSIRLWMK